MTGRPEARRRARMGLRARSWPGSRSGARSGSPSGARSGGRPGRSGSDAPPDPFAALGLDPLAELSDDDVRAAWRRVAAATHPDRDDGGDPPAFAAAAAAYTDLRTSFGRGEARADAGAGPLRRPFRVWSPWPRGGAGGASLVRSGRAARLVLRLAVATTLAAVSALAAGSGPAAPALITGAATWLLLGIWRDR